MAFCCFSIKFPQKTCYDANKHSDSFHLREISTLMNYHQPAIFICEIVSRDICVRRCVYVYVCACVLGGYSACLFAFLGSHCNKYSSCLQQSLAHLLCLAVRNGHMLSPIRPASSGEPRILLQQSNQLLQEIPGPPLTATRDKQCHKRRRNKLGNNDEPCRRWPFTRLYFQ